MPTARAPTEKGEVIKAQRAALERTTIDREECDVWYSIDVRSEVLKFIVEACLSRGRKTNRCALDCQHVSCFGTQRNAIALHRSHKWRAPRRLFFTHSRTSSTLKRRQASTRGVASRAAYAWCVTANRDPPKAASALAFRASIELATNTSKRPLHPMTRQSCGNVGLAFRSVTSADNRDQRRL